MLMKQYNCAYKQLTPFGIHRITKTVRLFKLSRTKRLE